MAAFYLQKVNETCYGMRRKEFVTHPDFLPLIRLRVRFTLHFTALLDLALAQSGHCFPAENDIDIFAYRYL